MTNGDSVYYAQCRDTTRIKIGYSRHPHRRVRTLNDGSPTLIELLAVEEGSQEKEAQRHNQFAAARVAHLAGTEWFYPVPPLLDLIVGLGGTPHRDPIVPGTVAGWYHPYVRHSQAERALQELSEQRREIARTAGRLNALYDLVYSMMRIRHGPSAIPHAPRDTEVSKRAAAEAADLVAWLSTTVASRMGPSQGLHLTALLPPPRSPI